MGGMRERECPQLHLQAVDWTLMAGDSCTDALALHALMSTEAHR